MKILTNIIILLVLLTTTALAQTKNVGIGTTTPDASAILDLTATDKGLLIPRMTTAQRDAIVNPVVGLLIYNTTDNKFQFYYGGWVNSILTTAVTSLNGQTGTTQTFGTGTTGTDFNISSAGNSHIFNIPDASSANRGLISTGVQTIAGAKTLTGSLTFSGIATDITTGANENLAIIPNGTGNVGIGTTSPSQKLAVEGTLGILETGTSPTYHTIFQGGDQTADITYTLPTTAPSINGQFLSATTAGVLSWVSSGGMALSALTAATAVNSINNANWAQTWNWNSAITENPMTLTANSLTTGSLFSLSGNAITTGSILDVTTNNASTLNSTNGLLRVANTGAGTNGIIFRAQSNSTAGSGLTVNAAGNVGIGTITPSQKLAVEGSLGILEGGTSPTFHTIFQGGDQTANITYTLPTAQGAATTFLQNDGSGNLSWVTGGSGGSSLSALTAATTVNSINNANWAQTWNWNSATTEIPLALTANGITTGSILDITSSNATTLNSTNGLLRVANTGAGTNGIIFRAQSNSTANSGLTLNAAGNLGINIAPDAMYKLKVDAGAVANTYGVYGQWDASHYGTLGFSNYGVGAFNSGTSVTQRGVYAQATGSGSGDRVGVYGNASGGTNNYGMQALAGGGTTNYGYQATVNGTAGSSVNYGVKASATSGLTSYGVYGEATDVNTATNYGVFGSATGANATGTRYGVWGEATGGLINWAGYFNGNVKSTGTLTIGTYMLPNSDGTIGQVLQTNGSGTVSWATVGSGSAALSSILAATNGNTIDNTTYAQTWNWSTATTQNPLSLSANGITTGSVLNITSSYGSGNSTNGLLYVANTGAITNGTIFRVQSNSTNPSYGLTVLASGNIGIGTTSPGQKLAVEGTLGILETGTSPTFHTIFQGGDQAANITYTLPTASPSSNGQVLSGTTAGVLSWTTVGSGSAALSSILAATAGNTIDNANFAQIWNWSSANTQVPLALTANAITTGTILDITSSSGNGSTNGLLRVANTGASSTGIVFRAQSNSTAGTGLTVLASGNVGIGTIAPSQKLAVEGTFGILETGTSPTFHSIFQGGDQTADITYTLPTAAPSSNGQVLSGTTAGVLSWTTVGSGSAALSSILAATNGNTIDNANFAQVWNWSSASTQIPMALSANAITTGTILDITSSNATTLNSTNGLLRVANTGAATSGLVFRAQSNSTAGSGLTVLASGNVGIGTIAPSQKLAVEGTFGILETGTSPTYHSIFQGGDQTADITYTLPTAAPSSNGQVLSGTTAGVLSWTTVGSGSAALSSILAATNGNTIDNANFAQVWNWSSASTQIPMALSANAITTGTILDITSSNATTLNSTNGLLRVANTGAATSGLVFRAQSNSTAGSGLTVLASGNVGIGTIAPSQKLAVEGTFGILETGTSPTYHTIFQGGDQAANITYTLPTAQGAASTYLQNDGSGNLSWVTGGGTLSGSGTANYLARWTGTTALGNSVIQDNGTTVGINNAPNASYRLLATGTSMTAIEGSYDGNILGYLGSITYGAYGQWTTTRFGYLGSTVYGAYGQYDANHYGYIGAGTTGIYGVNSGSSATEYAVQGLVSGTGATSKYAGWFSNTSTSAIAQYGAYGEVIGATGTGTKYGVYGTATGTGTVNYGIYGTASGATANWAGYFAGDLKTTGKLYILETGASPIYHSIFQGGDQAADLTYTLPTAYPTANGQVLSSTTAGVLSWATVAAGSSAISALTAATATNTIDNLNFPQIWNWSTSSTQTSLALSSNALTTGTILDITSNNPTTLNSSNGLLRVANTGASTTGLVFRAQSNSTAGSGLTVDASGDVGIGTTTPGQRLTVEGPIGILEGGASPSHHTILQGGTQATDVTYTLPTAAPTVNGQVLSATTAGVMSWGGSPVPTTVYKSSDQTKNNSTFIDDTDLHFSTIASTKYGYKIVVYYKVAATTGAFKYELNHSTTVNYGVANHVSRVTTGTTAIVNVNQVGVVNLLIPSTAVAAATANNVSSVVIDGTFEVNTAGVLSFQFAQNLTNATNPCTVMKGSTLTYWVIP